MQPLSGMLVVDFSLYLPGAFASRELLELGARVVCVEQPGGDPLRTSAPAWDAALRAGKDSLEVDLKRDPAPALELVREADVVLVCLAWRRIAARHRPRARARAAPSTARSPASGSPAATSSAAGHDLNYLGWAGALWDTAPALASRPDRRPRRRRAQRRDPGSSRRCWSATAPARAATSSSR